jgi:ADP-ribosylation factor related protein 1
MLANKQDVPGALKVFEIKEIFNPIAVDLGARYIEKINCGFRDSKVMSVSALSGEGITDALDWLQERMMRNVAHRPAVVRE